MSEKLLVISQWYELREVAVDGECGLEKWHFQVHPGAVSIVAVRDRHLVATLREWRPTTGRILAEIPSGRIDPGETPEQAAIRELHEEVGLMAYDLQSIGSVFNSPGSSDEVTHMFVTKAIGCDVEVAADWLDLAACRQELYDATSLLAVERAVQVGFLR